MALGLVQSFFVSGGRIEEGSQALAFLLVMSLKNEPKTELPQILCPKFQYASSKKYVTTVNEKKNVKAKSEWTCAVFAYGKNGCLVKAKLVVK